MISAHFWAPVRGAKFDRKLAEPNTRWRDFSLNRDSCAATLLYTAAVLLLSYKVFWSDFEVTYIKTTDFWNSVPANSTSKITKLHDKNNKVSLYYYHFILEYSKLLFYILQSFHGNSWKKKCWHPGLFTSTTNGMHFFEIVILISLHFYTGHISI